MTSGSTWKDLGFLAKLSLVKATGEETLFRVFGGVTSGLFGSFYSETRPESVSDAEFNSNVVKFGNRCLYVASFSVLPGAPLLIGRVDPTYEMPEADDGVDVFVWGNFQATQVYIELLRQSCFWSIMAISSRCAETSLRLVLVNESTPNNALHACFAR